MRPVLRWLTALALVGAAVFWWITKPVTSTAEVLTGLAPNLVGTPNDIRDLIHYRTDAAGEGSRVPKLAQGWRAEFVGRLFDDLLAGKTTIRIADATSESPLAFEKKPGA